MMCERILLVLFTAALLCGPAFAQDSGDNRDDETSGRVDRIGDGNSGQGDDARLRDEIYESLKERARARRHGPRENENRESSKDDPRPKPKPEEKSCKAQPKPQPPSQAQSSRPPTCPPPRCDGKQRQKPVLHAPSNPCRGKRNHGPHRQ